MDEILKSTLIGENIWQIEGPANDLMYLVLGKQKAMLVDTGMGIGSLILEVKNITSLPLVVINTHGHPDHAGGNGQFAQAWFPMKDFEIMNAMCTNDFRISDIHNIMPVDATKKAFFINALVKFKDIELLPYEYKSEFDLGDRKFTAVEIPGHTPGSMGLYNSDEKILFAGDSIVTSPVWMYLPVSLSLQTYYLALVHLREITKGLKTIFTGHLPTLAKPGLLDDLITCAHEILQNPGIGEVTKTFAGEGLLWTHGIGNIIYNPKKII